MQIFCALLLNLRHKGYTTVAHTMKGYVVYYFKYTCLFLKLVFIRFVHFYFIKFSGQFVMKWLLEQGTAQVVNLNI